MSGGELALAVGVFVVFGVVGVPMLRSSMADWREGRDRSDRVTMFSALEQAWPALLALLVAVGVPIALAMS
jgi:hypothetical protein